MKIELEFGERKENSKKFPLMTLRHTPTDSRELAILSFYIMESFNDLLVGTPVTPKAIAKAIVKKHPQIGKTVTQIRARLRKHQNKTK